jgi:UDP-3-O-[3-hydroxymyristoyl] N-acetylglucosamine deacetylase
VSEGDRLVRLEPSDGYRIDLTIAFDDPAIGTMRRSYTHGPGRFVAELARARTFGFLHEVEGLKAMGLARGGSLANAVVVEEGRVLNRDGLRAPDEFVRHKLLDCFGDLALAGGLLAAKVRAVKPGHRLHIAALNALLATPGAYVWEPEPPLAAEALAA